MSTKMEHIEKLKKQIVTSSGLLGSTTPKPGRDFLPEEKHLLAIIKSLQDELLRVTGERDEYYSLLMDCREQIQSICDAGIPKIHKTLNNSK